MALEARFCAQCGRPVERRVVGDRPRQVCPACGTVFYQNPLPVAAALVLNERRQVLLIKRRNEPHRGMWCLPIGFAEMHETIAQAAVRELKEEAGIDGQVLRLLDTDSYMSEFYGDLLIVTFELTNVGGHERAGDDAEQVAYFPLSRLPSLAFSSNEKAVRACAQLHLEEWAIQDSFQRLQAGSGAGLLSDALITLIRDQADMIARLWMAEVRSNPTTTGYRRIEAAKLLERGTAALSQFGRWLSGDEADQEVRDFYRALGRERKAQGCRVHEVLSSLTLLRKQIFEFSRKQGVYERPIDVYRVLELNRRIVAFFDKALYHSARGFAAGKNGA